MAKLPLNAHQYVPEQIRRLIKVSEKINFLQEQADELANTLVLDIIDGWSTKDPLLDFILVACGGVYDLSVITLQYRKLYDLAFRSPGQEIIIVQQADDWKNSAGPIILRNIILATLRADQIQFDTDTLTMRIPVNKSAFIWKEIIADSLLITATAVLDKEEWIPTGPLYNDYCPYDKVERTENFKHTPEHAVCVIDSIPSADPNYLETHCSVDAALLTELHQSWLRLKHASKS